MRSIFKVEISEKLEQKSKQTSSNPYSNLQSEGFDGIFWCVVTSRNSFYYRILDEVEEIEIITIFENRQDPNHLMKEMRDYFKT